MSQEGVYANCPEWLRQQIQQNARIWGVPTNFVGRKVSEARPKTTSPPQMELEEGEVDEAVSEQNDQMDVDMPDAEDEPSPSTVSPPPPPPSRPQPPNRIAKSQKSTSPKGMPRAVNMPSPSRLSPPSQPQPPTRQPQPSIRMVKTQISMSPNEMPRALNKPSPPVQPRSPLLSPRPIETSKPPTSRIETPRAKPSLKGKEKLATPVPLVDSGPSNILGQLDDSNLNQYTPKPLPSWYTRIESTSRGLKELNKRPTSDQSQYIKALSSMKGCIERCETGRGLNEDDLNELRNHVHKAEIGLKVDRFIVRKMRMLDEPYGLPRIFASTKMSVPMDLRMDAWQLYLRWYREEFEVDILRGIKTRQDRDRSADSIDPRWKKVPTKYYGEGDLVLGQWWPTQLCLVRDGAHGAAQGGIYGEKERGAYSIVLSGGSQYHDEDDGDTMWYSGTDGKDYMPTENTLRLVESLETVGNPIRVFRSHQLPKKNPYRPVVGLRYDGLYMIERKELINKEKQAFRFFLVRCPGQHPIRYGNNAAARPTIYEIKEDEKMRKFGR